MSGVIIFSFRERESRSTPSPTQLSKASSIESPLPAKLRLAEPVPAATSAPKKLQARRGFRYELEHSGEFSGSTEQQCTMPLRGSSDQRRLAIQRTQKRQAIGIGMLLRQRIKEYCRGSFEHWSGNRHIQNLSAGSAGVCGFRRSEVSGSKLEEAYKTLLCDGNSACDGKSSPSAW